MKWYIAIDHDGCVSIIEFDNRERMIDAVIDWKKSEDREVICVWSEVVNES